jgi:hypothetical protein
MRSSKKQRDWIWAWNPSIGPVYFNLYIDKTAEQLSTWLTDVAFYRYRLVDDVLARSKSGLRFSDGYVQKDRYEYSLRDDLYSWGTIHLADGLISFIRNFHTPSTLQQALDASLFAAIAAGELGEVSWDILINPRILWSWRLLM